ncbi:DUF1345 domain-containing protein [Nocardia nova]|uniref:DUF1345 domain-containing protein n=1 Tax=Nocardia nova TaxID=37330 RepID=UPI003014B091
MPWISSTGSGCVGAQSAVSASVRTAYPSHHRKPDPSHRRPREAEDLLKAAAALLAWFLLHLGFAEQYARTYYALRPDHALSFPGSKQPNLLDFAYFAFTIGVSFAVSDVETHHRDIRAQVLVHSVLGFFYNAAVIGVAVGVVTGGR